MPSNSNRSIGKSKISYYYSSKQGSVNSPSPLAAHGPSIPGQVCASHSCLPAEEHRLCQAHPPNTVSDHIYPGIFLACAEINKHRLNRALGIRERKCRGGVSTMSDQRGTEGHGLFHCGRAEGEENTTVTQGQDCYRALHNLYTASYINCVLL